MLTYLNSPLFHDDADDAGRYEDDREELEWDMVFNGAPMPRPAGHGREGVRVYPHSQPAQDLLDCLFLPQNPHSESSGGVIIIPFAPWMTE